MIDHRRAAAVALSGLPEVGPSRLRLLLARGPADAVWREIAGGRFVADVELAATGTSKRPIDRIVHGWRDAARAVDPEAELSRHVRGGVSVLLAGDTDWPAALLDDPDPPAVLFVLGDPAYLGARPAVAVVGTRQCSRYGWDVAHRLGTELAAAGVAVVSGLASGIDGAAHRGAIDGGGSPPIGVVATGLDVVYPRGHHRLWHEVAQAGALVSESPLGVTATRWRFPARNRIIAALAEAVVVVESAATGGAMHTVDEATRRDRPVLAVPGPVTSPSSRGTNRLLADGATPACDVDDVLVAIGHGGRRADAPQPPRPTPDGDAARVLDALGWKPATLDQLVSRTGLGVGALARLAAELELDGWLAVDGGWFERTR